MIGRERLLGKAALLVGFGLLALLRGRGGGADGTGPKDAASRAAGGSGAPQGTLSRGPESSGEMRMSGGAAQAEGRHRGDLAPGDAQLGGDEVVSEIRGYLIGLGLAALLTAVSFYVASGRSLVWSQGIPVALVVLAIAQIGVHLVFFLHITTAPDNTNNVLALAFGTLIVFLILSGSLWIVSNMNHNMMPMNEIMHRQR